MMFTLPIPSNAIISEAHVSFQVRDASSGPVTLRIFGEAVTGSSNPLAFNTSILNVSSRARTNNHVIWTPLDWLQIGATQVTSNIAVILQELVVQSGWPSSADSGKRIVLIIDRAPSDKTSNTRVAASGNTGGWQRPTLSVTYNTRGLCPFEDPL